MAAMTDAQQVAAWQQYMQNLTGELACSKADARAALDATDAWVDANWTSFNSALPAAFRQPATRKQKALLLLCVIENRFKVDA